MKKAINDLFLISFQNMMESLHKPKYIGNYSLVINKLISTPSINNTRTFKIYYANIKHDFLDDLITVEDKTEPYSEEEIADFLPSEYFLLDSPKEFTLWTISEDNIPEVIFRINQYLSK